MLFSGLRSKQKDMTTFGLVMAGLTFVAYKLLPDPLEIRWYSLLFVGVFLGGYSLFNWQIRRGGGGDEVAGDFIVYGVLGVLLGARLGHVLFYDLDHALEDPAWIFKIWTGGLASHGAVIGLVLVMYLFTRRHGVPFLEGADRFAFSATLGATLVRVGNFFNSEILGRPTNSDWGIRFPLADGANAPLRYPTQLYEIALGLFVMLVLYLVDRRLKETRPRGLLISLFFALYFAGRFVIEFYKEYQVFSAAETPLTMGQYLSIPGFLLGVYGVQWSLRTRLPAGWPREDQDDDEFEDEEDDDEFEDEEDDDELPSGGRAKAQRKARILDEDVEDEFDSRRPVSGDDDDAPRPATRKRPSGSAPQKQRAEVASSSKSEAVSKKKKKKRAGAKNTSKESGSKDTRAEGS
jgi:prolipoprotein diacylglyceryl transferase